MTNAERDRIFKKYIELAASITEIQSVVDKAQFTFLKIPEFLEWVYNEGAKSKSGEKTYAQGFEDGKEYVIKTLN